MYQYLLKEIFFKKKYVPSELIEYIISYLNAHKYLEDIKHKNYLCNGFWFKRITCRNVYEIKLRHMNYMEWYKVFHYKDYSLIIKYEYIKLNELLNTKTKEEILEIHMNNLENCHKKNYFSFKPKII